MEFSDLSFEHIDVITYVLKYLDPEEILRISLVSKKWFVSRVSRHDRIWKPIVQSEMSLDLTRILGSKQTKKLLLLESYYDKFKCLHTFIALKYNNEFDCFIHPTNEWATKNITNQDISYDTSHNKGHEAIKLVFVGDKSVGKTSMIYSIYGKNLCECDKLPSVADNENYSIGINGEVVKMMFWDTASLRDYEHLRPMSYPNTDVFVICFSLIDKQSLKNATEKWILEVKKFIPSASFVLCGCKSDLMDHEKTAVKRREAFIAASIIGASVYIESCCGAGSNVLHGKERGIVTKRMCRAFYLAHLIRQRSQSNKCILM